VVFSKLCHGPSTSGDKGISLTPQKSARGKFHQIGNEKRARVDRTDIPQAAYRTSVLPGSQWGSAERRIRRSRPLPGLQNKSKNGRYIFVTVRIHAVKYTTLGLLPGIIRLARDTPAMVRKGNWVSHFPQRDSSEVRHFHLMFGYCVSQGAPG
jgi:hypothetical protein